MSEKPLKFNNIILNKKKFHRPEEPIDLLSVDSDQIFVSHKFNIMTKVLSILLVI